MLLENREIVCWMLPISIFGMKSLERNPFHQHHMSGVSLSPAYICFFTSGSSYLRGCSELTAFAGSHATRKGQQLRIRHVRKVRLKKHLETIAGVKFERLFLGLNVAFIPPKSFHF